MKWRLRLLALGMAVTLLLSTTVLAAPVKLIALTFDDGPHNQYTPLILDVLQSRGARATFFILGEYLIDKGPLLERELAEGHQMGSHTHDHADLTKISDQEIRDQLSRLTERVREMTARPGAVFLLRPPFGEVNNRVLAQVDVPVIHWSIDPAQGKQVPGEKMAEYIISRAFDGAIVLLHDTTQFNVDAVAPVVDKLQAEGYEFVTVSELFRLKGISLVPGQVYRKAVNQTPQAYDEAHLDQHWAYPYISYVRQKGLMAGDSSGFGPNRSLTRAMAAAILWRMEGSQQAAGSAGFSDVPQGCWYQDAITWAVGEGLIQGVGGGCFGPDSLVTREEFYALVARLARRDSREVPSTAPDITHYQDDRRIHAWAKEDVIYLRQMGFDSDYDVELFRPLAEITRAEAAELLTWYLTG